MERVRPFRIVKKGEAKLHWGTKEDGSFWIKAICKHCMTPASLAVSGGRGAGSGGGIIRNKLLAESAGYSLVHYSSYTGCAKTTVIKDLCSTCFLHLSSYVRTTYGHKYLGRGKYKFPTSPEMMNHYYLKWKFAQLKTKWRKALKVQREGL